MAETLEMVNEFKERVRKTFEALHYDVRPRHPNILVRIIPKDVAVQLGAGKIIWLPAGADDKKQNKPVAEGQVLRVYEPFWRKWRTKFKFDNTVSTAEVQFSSDLRVDDHILFPHWSGFPVKGLCHDWRRGDYRLVPENEVLGVLEYSKDSIRERIFRIIHTEAVSSGATDRAVQDLLEVADVIFHEEARTLSGV